MGQAGGDPPLPPPVGAAAPATARKRASRSRVRAIVSDCFRHPRTFFLPQLASSPRRITSPQHCLPLRLRRQSCAPPICLPLARRLLRFSQFVLCLLLHFSRFRSHWRCQFSSQFWSLRCFLHLQHTIGTRCDTTSPQRNITTTTTALSHSFLSDSHVCGDHEFKA